MQHETGPLAIECHERCARFHILALHFERDRTGFSIALEEQQLMNSEDLSIFLFRYRVSDSRQRCKVSRNFVRTSAIASSRRMSLKRVSIIISSTSVTSANGTKIFHLPFSHTRFSSLPPSSASTFKPS